MIRISRPAMPEIPAFVKPTVRGPNGQMMSKAAREAMDALAFFTSPERYKGNQKITKAKYNFAVYKDRDLGAALEEVFGTKCAYCESDFGAVTPDDVEHFRPKSEVDTDGGTIRGYFWLAAEWTNLLVSCRDCNAGRYFRIPGEEKEVRLGKLSQFPLLDEGRRYGGPGPGIGEEATVQLLIDPCLEEPSEHLTWDDKALVYARPTAANAPSPKGEASIRVYALQREGLVKARKARLLDFQFHVADLQKTIRRLNRAQKAGDQEVVDEELDSIERLKEKITGMLQPREVYVGMLRDWIRTEKAAGHFADLEQFQIDLESWI